LSRLCSWWWLARSGERERWRWMFTVAEESRFVARAADRPDVWMVGSASSLLLPHFYTGVVVHRRHGWGDRCPFKFRFSPPYLFLAVFRVVLWKPGEQGGWVVVGLFGSVERKMGGKGRLPGLLCQGKGGCFRSKNHRPKGRVCGGWRKEKGEGSLRFSLAKVREVRGGCLDLLVFQKGRGRWPRGVGPSGGGDGFLDKGRGRGGLGKWRRKW
jgi:hypothetical protein